MIYLSLKDEGVGFSNNTTNFGIGLKNVTERIRQLSGTILIASNNGVSFEIKIPIDGRNE